MAQDPTPTARLAETPLPELVAELAEQAAAINAARARQVELVAAITHTQTVEAEDGTLLHLPMGETYARLDAAALVAGSLGVSQQAAHGWVDRAEKLIGPLSPVHVAMAEGVLDEARAKIICEELDEVSDEVAALVAERLMPTVRDGLVEDPSGENGVRLRRRVQAALAAVDPDAVRERAKKNRSDRCLRRWTSKAGVEEWLATLPAAQSIRAWAAIDALARDFIKDGRCETLDQARADAMVALIEGQSTVSYVVTLGIPLPEHLDNPAPVTDPPAPEAGAAGLKDHSERRQPELKDSAPAVCAHDDEPTTVHHSVPEGCGAGPDLADEAADEPRGESPVQDVVAAALAALAWHGDTDIEITGAGNPQATDVNAAWVADALAQAAHDGQVRLAAVHPGTGALIDPDNTYATTAYVPGKALAGLVKARDGRCRFPGCTLNVRFTDLDHARPWPTGDTDAENLHSLCRRHHRVKQLPGWQVCLRPDGTILWVDPLGRRSLTRPLDHRGRPQSPPTRAPASPVRSLAQQAVDRAVREKMIAHALRREGPVSILEEHLDHALLAAAELACRTRTSRQVWRYGRHPERVRADLHHLHLHRGEPDHGSSRSLGQDQGNDEGHGRHGRTDLRGKGAGSRGPVGALRLEVGFDSNLDPSDIDPTRIGPSYDEPPF